MRGHTLRLVAMGLAVAWNVLIGAIVCCVMAAIGLLYFASTGNMAKSGNGIQTNEFSRVGVGGMSVVTNIDRLAVALSNAWRGGDCVTPFESLDAAWCADFGRRTGKSIHGDFMC